VVRHCETIRSGARREFRPKIEKEIIPDGASPEPTARPKRAAQCAVPRNPSPVPRLPSLVVRTI